MVLDEPGDHGSDVRRFPFVLHKRLSKSDVAKQDASSEEISVADSNQGLCGGVRVSKLTNAASGKLKAKRPSPERLERVQDSSLIEFGEPRLTPASGRGQRN